MAGDEPDDGAVPRGDFESAVRFVADGGMQAAHRARRIEAVLRSVVRALAEAGQLDLDAFERNLQQPAPPPAGKPARIAIEVGAPVDKYTVASPQDLDCAALIPLCGARCCTLTFALGPQDLDEGRVAWSYARPYQIARGPDHRCVHQDRESGGCTIYEHRPAVCRGYDCRTDKRIWEDFEKRIPARQPPDDPVLPLGRRP
jgi:Fe-S-cluster containining protein